MGTGIVRHRGDCRLEVDGRLEMRKILESDLKSITLQDLRDGVEIVSTSGNVVAILFPWDRFERAQETIQRGYEAALQLASQAGLPQKVQ